MPKRRAQKITFPVKFPLSKKSKKNLEEVPFKKLFIASLGTSILTILIVVSLQGFLPPQVPLFYGRPIPDNKLAPGISLVIPSAISLGVVLLNFAVAYVLNDIFLKRILIASTFAASLLSTITTIRIMLLVGSF